MKIDRKEILRYMGWRKGEPDGNILKLIDDIAAQFESNVTPRYSSKKVAVTVTDSTVMLDNVTVESADLATHLRDTKTAILLAATLGTEADNIIRRKTVEGTLNLSIAQASGAAMIEGFLDEVCEGFDGFTLPRFSPGYGDWSLSDQTLMLELTDAAKRCGITLTDSFMMVPTKSVTAIVGLSDKCNKEKHSCINCDKKDCDFRK